MKNNIYLGLVLAVYMGMLSKPVLAINLSTPKSNISSQETCVVEIQKPTELHRQEAQYDKLMAKHHKALALVDKNVGHRNFHKRYEKLASYHEELVNEYQKAADLNIKMTE